MLYFLIVLGLGISIGCSVASSDTEQLDNGILRTKYIYEFRGHRFGWNFDRSFLDKNNRPSLYRLSFIYSSSSLISPASSPQKKERSIWPWFSSLSSSRSSSKNPPSD